MIIMENDIFIKAIKETVEEYVKDNVRVSVYKTEPKEYWSKYTIQLDNSAYHTKYELDNRYCNERTYIMRVVSDLCINLAKMTQREQKTKRIDTIRSIAKTWNSTYYLCRL